MPMFSQLLLENAKIAPEIFTLRPDYRALLLVVSNISPGPSDSISEALLQQAEISARAALSTQSVTEISHVAAWRDTYKAFGAKPKKERSSLESLMRRAEAGLPRVNRLTDIYNALSVKFQIPFGGEDLDKYDGVPVLVRAKGNEPFETSVGGEKVTEFPPEGEVVTGITEDTTRVLFIMDALEPCDDANLEAAADELVEVLKSLGPGVSEERRIMKRES
ncbi:hypothetical protein E8E13_001096 [Curvularia kusanoi]|uniref:B3/B4 tRNA-binding domain-containing protein n=1 Tax=Curvularia kusanoi TaxID=90978 RepID=A0A9P4W5T1_CURKU|nr:hypothetical protein E8E13_001096 [Curvularia kusanoi]